MKPRLIGMIIAVAAVIIACMVIWITFYNSPVVQGTPNKLDEIKGMAK